MMTFRSHILTTTALAAGSLVLPNIAIAGDCLPRTGSLVIVCSGAASPTGDDPYGTIDPSGPGAATVTLLPGFGVDHSATPSSNIWAGVDVNPPAFNGDISVIDASNATIIGRAGGIGVTSATGGNVSIVTNSTITTVGGSDLGTAYGILGRSLAGGSISITLNAGGSVSGQTWGIRTSTLGGAGTLDVTTHGDVTSGGAGFGIYAINKGSGTTTISTNGVVSGGDTGILAANSDAEDSIIGTGNHIVMVNGDVTGGSGAAIDTQTQAGSHTELTLNGGAISATSGLAILNNEGDSDTVVTAAAVVVGSVQLASGTDNLTFDGSDISQTTVLDGGDDVSTADGWTDVLTFKSVSGAVAGANLQNWEKIVVDAGTTLAFTDAGLTTGSEAGMGLFISSGGTVNGAVPGNAFTVTGNVTNAGLLRLDDGAAGDTFTVTGDYDGQGGTVTFDVYLGGDASPTDLLVINGDTSGSSLVQVTNVGGPGAPTTNGIKIIDITGASDGVFALVSDYQLNGQNMVVAGAYGYGLFKNGVTTPADGDWYLRSQSTNPTEPTDPTQPTNPTNPTNPTFPTEPTDPTGPVYQPGAPVFEVYPQVLLGLNGLPTLQQRVGNRFWSGNGAGVAAEGADMVGEVTPSASTFTEGSGIWARIEGAHALIEPKVSTTGADYDYNTLKLQAGVDVKLLENENGALIGGVFGQYGHASADVRSYFGNGDISTDAYGFGGTLAWYGNNGFYVDGQAQMNWFNSDLTSTSNAQVDGLGNLISGNDGKGYALSAEAGKRIDLNGVWTMTPQAQLVYSSVDFDTFDQMIGNRRAATVSLLDGDSLRGRLGVTLDKESSWQAENGTLSRSHVYGIGNLYYEFLNGAAVDVAGSTLTSRQDRLWGGIGAGGSYNWNDDRYSIYGEGSVNTSLEKFGDSYELKGTLGFRVKW